MRQLLKVMTAVGALTLVAGVSACGSSSKSASSSATTGNSATSSTSPSSSSSAAPTGSPIVVGVICTCSGALATATPSGLDAYEAFVKTANASGGINGHPIKTIVKDDGGTPGTSVSDLQELLSDHIVALNDLSLVDQPWATTIQKADIPVVGSNNVEAPFITNPDFYPAGQTNDSTTYSLVAAAKAAGATSVGEVYCAELAVCQALEGLSKTAAQKLGVSFAYGGSAAASAPNFTAQCVAAKQANVDALILNLTPQTVERFAADCKTQNYTPTIIQEQGGVNTKMFTAPGMSNLWMTFGNYPFFVSSPAVNTMNAAINKYFPGLQSTAGYSGFAEQGWAGGLLLEAAVKGGGLTASGTPSSAEIIQGLNTMSGNTLGGITAPLTFRAGQAHPIDCWFTAKEQNGATSIVNNGQLTCENTSSS